MTLKIDVYFDTICPWCWIGKRNLEKATELWKKEEIEIHYKKFFLDETIPLGGVPAKGHLQKKYGMTDQQLKDYLERLFQLGREAEVEFDYDKIKITPNTIASHILIDMADNTVKSDIIERVFEDFFYQGKNIGDENILKEIAEDFNIPVLEFEQNLLDQKKRQNVINEVYTARMMGIRGVPYYVVNDKYSFSGAQKPEVIIQALDNVLMRENSIRLL